jgi:hypothetical protein
MDQKLHSKATAARKKEQRAADASDAWREHRANQKATDDNMMRLRAERQAREKTLPQMQGDKERPRQPGKSSKHQNTADRP